MWLGSSPGIWIQTPCLHSIFHKCEESMDCSKCYCSSKSNDLSNFHLSGAQISELKQKVQESESLISALQQAFSQAKRNTQEQMVWPNTHTSTQQHSLALSDDFHWKHILFFIERYLMKNVFRFRYCPILNFSFMTMWFVLMYKSIFWHSVFMLSALSWATSVSNLKLHY